LHRPSRRIYIYLAAVIVLALALVYGRTRTAPDLGPPIREIFPAATAIEEQHGVFFVYGPDQGLIGWAAAGSVSGYGGPMLVVAGLDTEGTVVGARIVEQRETPAFWSMVRADDYIAGICGSTYDAMSHDYVEVAGVTGATISSGALVDSIRASIVEVAGTAFDVHLPLPRRPFEFGILEITVLVLILGGVGAQRLKGPTRRRVRWAAQITGLVVIGFWKDSPIALAKLAAMASGFFPDPRVSLALYVLIAGFLITSFAWGRNVYCLYTCPFGAAQRCVGVVGGKKLTLPLGVVRFLERLRNLIVFVVLFMALLTLQPTLASYEPFSTLFSLRGSTLQWVILFVALVASLVLRDPWCDYGCPMRTVESALRDLRRLFGRRTAPVTQD
jgi:hypothetical protein